MAGALEGDTFIGPEAEVSCVVKQGIWWLAIRIFFWRVLIFLIPVTYCLYYDRYQVRRFGNCLCLKTLLSHLCPLLPSTTRTPSFIFFIDERMEWLYLCTYFQEHRGLMSLRYPMEHGIVKDWNDMERIWQYIYSKDQLQTFSEEVNTGRVSKE